MRSKPDIQTWWPWHDLLSRGKESVSSRISILSNRFAWSTCSMDCLELLQVDNTYCEEFTIPRPQLLGDWSNWADHIMSLAVHWLCQGAVGTPWPWIRSRKLMRFKKNFQVVDTWWYGPKLAQLLNSRSWPGYCIICDTSSLSRPSFYRLAGCVWSSSESFVQCREKSDTALHVVLLNYCACKLQLGYGVDMSNVIKTSKLQVIPLYHEWTHIALL